MQTYANLWTILLLFTFNIQRFGTFDTNGKSQPSLTLFKDLEGECNTYCLNIVKPILQQTKQHHFSELQDKIRELDGLLKVTEQQVNTLKIKLGVCENATAIKENLLRDQLNRKTSQLNEHQRKADAQEESVKNLETQLTSLQNRIGICEETVRNKEVQFTQLKELNVSCNNSSRIKDDLIETNKALINRHNAVSEGELIKLELKDRRITELEANVKLNEQIVVEQRNKIAKDDLKIKQLVRKLFIYDKQIKTCHATSCLGKSTDIHVIILPGAEPFPVFCDSHLVGSGWTVLLRRRDGSVNFFRNWNDYRIGFGDLRGEFFMGLQKIHLITSSRRHELLIHLQDFDNQIRYAYYDNFKIGNEADDFSLHVLGEYNGTAGDALSVQKYMKFSTPDRDNDQAEINCAQDFGSGWWFRKCYYCNLNGIYFNSKRTNQYGINWFAWHKNPLRFVQMMIRPKRR
ncbi:hypothetical protein AWZ03_010062 [Drosophila navojoa]|uniref:Fibrinogen C-terminal domain-containing protein n=1 Tax=Drosophila navojoa TaxID=7232 RepID=A0A484B4D3_DRONA|nr:hypothetical protein AWZ03_010062 [Drosophila navojoa]